MKTTSGREIKVTANNSKRTFTRYRTGAMKTVMKTNEMYCYTEAAAIVNDLLTDKAETFNGYRKRQGRLADIAKANNVSIQDIVNIILEDRMIKSKTK